MRAVSNETTRTYLGTRGVYRGPGILTSYEPRANHILLGQEALE